MVRKVTWSHRQRAVAKLFAETGGIEAHALVADARSDRSNATGNDARRTVAVPLAPTPSTATTVRSVSLTSTGCSDFAAARIVATIAVRERVPDALAVVADATTSAARTELTGARVATEARGTLAVRLATPPGTAASAALRRSTSAGSTATASAASGGPSVGDSDAGEQDIGLEHFSVQTFVQTLNLFAVVYKVSLYAQQSRLPTCLRSLYRGHKYIFLVTFFIRKRRVITRENNNSTAKFRLKFERRRDCVIIFRYRELTTRANMAHTVVW